MSNEIENDPFENPIHARIAQIDKVCVAHPKLVRAINGLVDCISWSVSGREPRGAILIGGGGAGKTTICNAILKKFPIKEVEFDGAFIKTVPAFYASVPSPSSIRSLASTLLRGLGDPSPERGAAKALTDRLVKLLKTCQTRAILLDEFHNLLAEASSGEQRAKKICNWLRTLINATGVMVGLIGIPECESLVDYDTQMARRFADRFQLHNLGAGSKEKPGELSGFLQALSRKFVERLQLSSFVDFTDHFRVMQMWAATDGNPAFVVLLLKEASAIALTGGSRNTVVIGDLADAFDKGITRSVARLSGNPFAMSRQKLASAISSRVIVDKEGKCS